MFYENVTFNPGFFDSIFSFPLGARAGIGCPLSLSAKRE
jgi:hypothetical protein